MEYPPRSNAPLSSKAKGKQRAPSQDSTSPSSRALYVNVRFTTSIPDILALALNDEKLTSRQVKSLIRDIRPDALNDKSLRLIYLGRVITDGIQLLPWLEALLLRQQGVTGEGQSLLEAVGLEEERSKPIPGRTPETAVWLICSVGQAIEAASEDAPPAEVAEEPIQPPAQGFDRLLESGFSQDDVNNMRRQFHVRMDSSNVEHGPVVIDDENEHQRALEDQWIEGMGNSEMNVNGDTSGEYTTLLKGLILGFIFPIMPLFFFRTSLFSKRFQMGILTGMMVNLGFAVVQLLS